jgi:hypothetical protein
MYAIIPENIACLAEEVEKSLGNDNISSQMTPYNFTDCSCTIVEEAIFKRTIGALELVYEVMANEETKDNAPIKIVPSVIDGLVTAMHWFYENDICLDNLIPGEFKEQDVYKHISSKSSSSRFVFRDFNNVFKAKYKDLYGETRSAQTTESAPTVAETEPSVDVEFENMSTEQKLVSVMKSLWSFDHKIKDSDEKEVICTYASQTYKNIVQKCVENLSFKGKKKVIFTSNVNSHLKLISERAIRDHGYNRLMEDVLDNFIILNLDGIRSPNTCSKFERLANGDYFCLGENIDGTVLSSLLKHDDSRKESPYKDYSAIYKDYETGVVFALQKQNEIDLLFSVGVPLSKDHCVKLITNILYKLLGTHSIGELKELHKKYYEEIEPRIVDEFVELSVENASSHIKEIEEFISKAVDDIGDIQKQLFEKMKVYEKYRKIYEHFDKEDFYKKEREKALGEFQAAKSLNKVKKIFVKDKLVHVYTENIYAQDVRSNLWYDIGTFHITIGFLQDDFSPERSVVIKNTKHQVFGYSNQVMQAPHVFKEGNMCAGNLVTAVSEHYKNRDLYGIILDIIGFLESANTDDVAGSYVNRWPQVPEEVVKGDSVDFGQDPEEIEKEKEFDEHIVDVLPIK